MAIYVDSVQVYSTKSTSLNTSISMTSGKHSIVVQATISTGGTYSADLSLTVAAITPLQVTTTTLANGTVGAAYSATLQAAGGTTPYTWSLASGSLPAGLALSSGGIISGTPTVSETSSFSIAVRDSESPPKTITSTLVLTIAPAAPLQITSNTLANGTVGTAYSATLQAAGGATPYTWSLALGSLPAGLTLSTGGVISGTPTASGTSSFSVSVKDSETSPQIVTSAFAITIAQPPPLQLTTTTLPNGTVGSSYSSTLQATGGVAPYRWSLASGSLPTGLTLSSGEVISGIPSASGTFTFSLTVTDSEAPPVAVTSAVFTVIIAVAPLQLTTSTLANGTVGSVYASTLQATGGTAPYTWSLASGSLPAGLTLSTGGVISGTPTASGTSSFNVTVTDSEVPPQVVTSGTLTLTIAPVSNASALAAAYAAYTISNYTSAPNYTGSNTYYVSSTGSDSNAGTATAPWATLAHAVLAVSGCALVLVEPGTYSVPSGRVAKIANSGTSACHTAYVATAYASSFLVAADDRANDPAIWITGSYVDLVGFDVTNPKGCMGVYPNGTYTNLFYNRIHDIDNGSGSYSCGNGVGGGGIVGEIGTSTYNTWSENIVWNIGPSGDHYTHGIYTAAPYATIQNNIVYNASAGCIQAYHQPSNDIISNNTLVGCYWGYIVGADSGYAASNMVFNNNIVANNTQYGIYECGAASCGVAMGSNNTYSNNITYSNADQMEGGTLVNNLTSDPELIDVASPASSGNFAVGAGSPAIGAGTTSDAPLSDILGVSRGSSVTIGAYE